MAKRILLVEGTDDEHVVKHLCKRHEIEIVSPKDLRPDDNRPVVLEYGGIEQLLGQVLGRLKESSLERLGVVLDADEDAQSRWAQLRDRLRRAGYREVPDEPERQGTILSLPVDQRNVLLGVWIMPDNRLPGMLEDFLMFLIPEGDRTLPHVDRFLGSIPPADRLFSETARAKARIHSYLAVQQEPGKPLGLAITFRYLDAKTEAVQPFVKWLTSVLLV